MDVVADPQAACALNEPRVAGSGQTAPLRPTDARLDPGHDALALETCRSHRRRDLLSDGGYALTPRPTPERASYRRD